MRDQILMRATKAKTTNGLACAGTPTPYDQDAGIGDALEALDYRGAAKACGGYSIP